MTKVFFASLALLILPWISTGAALHLKRREIRTDLARPTIPAAGPRWTAERSHLMLRFRAPWNESISQELNRRGAYVVGALPDAGVMLSVRNEFSLEGLDIDWAGRLETSDKLSPIFNHRRDGSDSWLVAEFFADVDMDQARRLAGAAGFQVHEHPDLIATHLLLSGPAGRLKGLAQWDEVAYLFPASRELIRGDRVRHCSGALTTAGVTPMYAVGGSGWPKDANGQVILSYLIGSLTPKLSADDVRQELARALNAWTVYAPIHFVPGQGRTSAKTVWINFFSKDHGDGFPFDGVGNTLAHTFYPAPPNPESIAGDMHLDADEEWKIGANTDLFTVAVHEAGHALGLAHVDNPASVMYPYYRLGAKIGADDIAGIQSLYGSPDTRLPPVNDPAPLTLTVTAPAVKSTTTANSISAAGSTTGGDADLRVTWQTDHGNSGVAAGSTNWTASAIPLAVGSNTITVTATDNSRTSVRAFGVTRTAPSIPSNPANPSDRTPPTLAITWPAGNILTTKAAMIDVKGTAADATGVAKVTWQAPSGSGTATGTAAWVASGIPLVLGDNTLLIRAYDAAGNMSWRSVLVIRN